MQTFADFGRVNRKLWTGDYGLGLTGGIQKVLVDGVKLKSSIGADWSATNSMTVDTDQHGQGKLGLNISGKNDRPGEEARPSVFARWSYPIVRGTNVGLRIHKPHWSNDCMPFMGLDYKYQNPNFSATTSLGSNLTDHMDQKTSRPFEISHSVAAGNDSLSVGGEVKYAPEEKGFALTDYNLGIDWNKQGNYGVGLRSKDKFRHLTGTTWKNINQSIRVGGLHSYDIHNGTAKTGVALQVGDEHLRVKAKADTGGDLGFSMVARVCDMNAGAKLTPGLKAHGNITYNFRDDQPKHAGLGFSFGDI